MQKKTAQAPTASGNAKQALQELISPFGFKGEATAQPQATPTKKVEQPTVQKGTPPMKEVQKPANVQVTASPSAPSTVRPTIISAGSEVTGNIKSQGDMNVEGIITGDTAANGKLTVTGTIKGNIDAADLDILGGRVEAELIKAKGAVLIEAGAEIIGNIQCESIVCNGKVKGSLIVSDKCEINLAAMIDGDVQAKELSMQPGATLVGRVSVTAITSHS